MTEMKCNEAKSKFFEFLRGELEKEQVTEIQEHLNSCLSCQKDFASAKLAHSLIRADSELRTELPVGFEENLHSRLVEAAFESKKGEKEDREWRFIKWRSIAIMTAAMVLIMLGVAVGFYLGVKNPSARDTKSPAVKEPSFNNVSVTAAVVPVGRPIKMKLTFNSEVELANVNFSIVLPQGVSFETSDNEVAGLRELKWQNTLNEGKTEIPFVVKAEIPGKWKIYASAEKEGVRHTHEIILEVLQNGR